jgi:hypothetical protein
LDGKSRASSAILNLIFCVTSSSHVYLCKVIAYERIGKMSGCESCFSLELHNSGYAAVSESQSRRCRGMISMSI